MTAVTTTDVLGHYRRVAPLLVEHFHGMPFVTARYPDAARGPVFSASLHGPAPGGEPTVDVPSGGGVVQYLAVAERSLLAAVHRGAIELHSWTPLGADPMRARFARMLVRPSDGDAARAKYIALALRAGLSACGLDALVLLDGPATLALWVPFSDGPGYVELRAWMHAFGAELASAHPGAFAVGEVHVTSNAVGHWSVLPYALLGADAAHVATPVRWEELETIAGALGPDAVAERLADDAFGAEVRRIGKQRFGAAARRERAMWTLPELLVQGTGHGQVLAAVRAVLADGHAHSAEEI